MKRDCARGLLARSDVAAAGFEVSDGPSNASVTIERLEDGSWRVVDSWARDGWSASVRARAVSVAAAVTCGANLVGVLVNDLVIDAGVRWVRVTKFRRVCQSTLSRRNR